MRRESRAGRWGMGVSWIGSALVASVVITGPLAAQQRDTEADRNAGEGRFAYEEDLLNMVHVAELIRESGWKPGPGFQAPPPNPRR